MPDIRCDQNKKFGVVSENSIGIFEATCDSGWHQPQPGEVILHRWNLEKINEDGTIRPIQNFRLKRPK